MSDNSLAMSDEDFINTMPPAVEDEQTSQEAVQDVVAQEPAQEEPSQTAAEESTEVTDPVEVKQEVNPLDIADGDVPRIPQAQPVSVEAPQGEAAAVSVDATGGETNTATVVTVDKAAEYDRLLAPIQANGRQIQLKNTEEVLRMVQMGANYTRKMQELAPHRKVINMLESNGLLDEAKLSFLIDLDKRDPAAIKQLVKDSGIDPMDIDTTEESGYVPGSHQISDAEDNFRAVLDEVTSTDSGRETVQIIHQSWDQASKQVLMESPEVLPIIQQQRENGIYDTIMAEMDRQKTLGNIPPNIPLLQAYKLVGDHLSETGGFQALVKQTETTSYNGQTSGNVSQPAQRGPVATTVGTPKATVANDERAKAAAPSNTNPAPAKSSVNPLSMSDDEFMAQMSHRV